MTIIIFLFVMIFMIFSSFKAEAQGISGRTNNSAHTYELYNNSTNKVVTRWNDSNKIEIFNDTLQLNKIGSHLDVTPNQVNGGMLWTNSDGITRRTRIQDMIWPMNTISHLSDSLSNLRDTINTKVTALTVATIIASTATYGAGNGLNEFPAKTFVVDPVVVMMASRAEDSLNSLKSLIATNTFNISTNTSGITAINVALANYYNKTQSDTRYLQSFTEVDPIWTGVASTYRTKTQNDALYEPIFSKNTGFNKNFGSVAGTITEGNDARVLLAVSALQPTGSGSSLTGLTKTQVGLSNVDNTSDANKPISTATQTALNLKFNTPTGTTNQFVDGSGALQTSKTTLSQFTNNVPFLTTNQSMTFTGDVTGSGTTSIPITLNTVATAGTYGRVVVNAKGLVTSGKRQETYSGTTDGSGNYTVTFATAYSVVPNVQANLVPQTATNQYARISSITTTGFTVNAYSFNSNNLLGIISLVTTTSNIVGATIDVLISEK